MPQYSCLCWDLWHGPSANFENSTPCTNNNLLVTLRLKHIRQMFENFLSCNHSLSRCLYIQLSNNLRMMRPQKRWNRHGRKQQTARNVIR